MDSYQIAFVVLLGRVLDGQHCCLESVCVWKPFLGSAAHSPSMQHIWNQNPLSSGKSNAAFWKTALFQCWHIVCVLTAAVFLFCQARRMSCQHREITSSGVFNKRQCMLTAIRKMQKVFFPWHKWKGSSSTVNSVFGSLVLQIFITASTRCRLIYWSCFPLVRGLGSVHQCKNMHWAGVMESKVKDQPQGRQIFGRRCGRYFCIQIVLWHLECWLRTWE